MIGEHRFVCSVHGPFTVVAAPPRERCPVRGACPDCDKLEPWFNTDIDAGPYGWLGAPILKCIGQCAEEARL